MPSEAVDPARPEGSPPGGRPEGSPPGGRPEGSPPGGRPEGSPLGERPQGSVPEGLRPRSPPAALLALAPTILATTHTHS